MHDTELLTVNIGLVKRPNPPIREKFDDEYMESLTASIRENGIITPLTCVRRGSEFEVIDGDCRLQGAWDAGLREIPIVVRVLTDSEVHVQRMLANKDRSDTDPVSEAKYIARLVADGIFTPESYAEKCGKSLAWVAGRLEIAQMPDYMQQALSEKKVNLGVAIELHLIKDANTKERYFKDAVRNGMTNHFAHIIRLQMNEAIEALQEQGLIVSEETLPNIPKIPVVQCILTGDNLPITETRMVRVGVRNFEALLRGEAVLNRQMYRSL
jgi:ParB/RepB/Spo0J family partition protein